MRRIIFIWVIWAYAAVLAASLFVPLRVPDPQHCTDLERGFYAFFGTMRDMCR